MRPPLLDPYRPTWAEIDLDALTDNFAAVRRRVGRTPILAVVKADGYGHGAVEVARALEQAGAACFGVALPEEGVELRRAGVRVPILLLGGFALPQADLVLAHDLVPAVFRPDQVEALAAAAGSRGVRASVHLKIDTGMGRLGVPVEDVGSFAPILAGSPCLQVTGAFSHLAVADDPADPYTARQIALFKNALATLRTYGLNPSQVHLANSAAITDYESAWLTLVRPGIILFGYPPSEKVTSLPVRPVLSLKTCIIYIKEVPPGASLGYGRSFVATRPTRVASVPIGYDDGLPRLLGNRGHVLVRGHRAPIIGRVSMDLTTVDVTDIPAASLGDAAVVIGTSGRERLGAVEIAAWAETISWDILCGIGSRVPRLYVRGADRSIVSRFGHL